MGRGIILPPDGVPLKTTYRCPHCGVVATITPIGWTLDKWIAKCDNPACGRSFFADVSYTGFIAGHPGEPSLLEFTIIDTHPKYVPERHESIPENIWLDYAEAFKCYDADASKATVVMCRRAMQNACLGKGAKKQDANGKWVSLKDQIKSAFPQKDYELLNKMAGEIKYLGDYGAHPQDDQIDDVRIDDAKTVLDFTGQILDIAYVQPWKIKQLYDKRK